MDLLLTCNGELLDERSVNPTMSLKKMVTLSKDSGTTCMPLFSWFATGLAENTKESIKAAKFFKRPCHHFAPKKFDSVSPFNLYLPKSFRC